MIPSLQWKCRCITQQCTPAGTPARFQVECFWVTWLAVSERKSAAIAMQQFDFQTHWSNHDQTGRLSSLWDRTDRSPLLQSRMLGLWSSKTVVLAHSAWSAILHSRSDDTGSLAWFQVECFWVTWLTVSEFGRYSIKHEVHDYFWTSDLTGSS